MVIKLRPRKTQKIRTSLWVSIPIEWVNHHQLGKGDILEVELYEGGEALILRPNKAGGTNA